MRLCCVSDIHLSNKFGFIDSLGATKYFDWLVEFFHALDRDDDVDHLIVAGDLVGWLEDPSTTPDFTTFRELLDDFGWYTGEHCTLVPGNHDVRLAGHNALKPLAPAGRIPAFHRVFPGVFRGRSVKSRQPFPTVKLFDDVAVIGLDTVSHMADFTMHSGELGTDQLTALDRLLQKPSITDRIVIIAMHNPPYSADPQWPLADRRTIVTGNLRDANDFWGIVDGSNCDLIVAGHEHSCDEDVINDVEVITVGGFMKEDRALIVDATIDKGLNWWWWNPWG